MPTLLPPPMPRFSCSIKRTSGKRSETKAAVPSLEPLSTTIVSWPATQARQRSRKGREFQVTTTTETSSGIRVRHGTPPQPLPEDHDQTRRGEQERHEEEEEAGRKGVVGVDAEAAEEADEE